MLQLPPLRWLLTCWYWGKKDLKSIDPQTELFIHDYYLVAEGWGIRLGFFNGWNLSRLVAQKGDFDPLKYSVLDGKSNQSHLKPLSNHIHFYVGMIFCLTNPHSPHTLPTVLFVQKESPDREIWHVYKLNKRSGTGSNSQLMNHKDEKILWHT
jgi:hypothetical protein